MSVKELQEICRENKLKIKGRKDELIDRIKEHFKQANYNFLFVVLYIMSNNCSNQNEVFQFFNLMRDVDLLLTIAHNLKSTIPQTKNAQIIVKIIKTLMILVSVFREMLD